MDRITIRDLKAMARIGVSGDERAVPQPLRVTVEITADLGKAGATDDLADTIDYDRTTSEVAEIVRTSNCKLLERLAERIAGHIAGTEGVTGVTVEVSKESPPVSEEVGAITVRIERPS